MHFYIKYHGLKIKRCDSIRNIETKYVNETQQIR